MHLQVARRMRRAEWMGLVQLASMPRMSRRMLSSPDGKKAYKRYRIAPGSGRLEGSVK